MTQVDDPLPNSKPDTSQEEVLRRFMELRIWPGIPASAFRRWTKDEEESALGYGESGEPV